jgi:hypothetical protein
LPDDGDANWTFTGISTAMQIMCACCGSVNDEDASVLWESAVDGHDFCSRECQLKFEQQSANAVKNAEGNAGRRD